MMSHLPGPSPRRELVAYLAGEGMSTRAIAPIVGVSKSQVANDVEVSRTGHVGPAPTPIHGRDGKTYTRPEPQPASAPRRRPWPEAADEAAARRADGC